MAKIRTDHKEIAETDFQIWYRYSQIAQSSRLAGILLSLFLAIITYFMQGGRMISETQIKPG